MAAKRLVVQEHAPWRQWIWIGVISAVFGIGSYALYSYTVSRLPYEWEQLEIERAKLEVERKELARRIRELKEENRRQAERVVSLERGVEIEKESAKALHESLRDMQDELAAQEEQLAFYRGIVSPDQSKVGVRIYDFEVRDGGEPGLYMFDLILIQAVRHDKSVSGEASVEIRGMQGGVEQVIPLQKVSVAREGRLEFSFRYFQDLSGAFRLPKGFSPSAVHVKVNAKSSGAMVERDFQWSAVREGAGA